MTMNPLPPQAYTKDTLLKAYHWLQAQPSHIKEMAMTPDVLVSLYLKASRDGDESLERPSIQNFKSELKSLAGLMGELERPSFDGHSIPAPEKPNPAFEKPIPSAVLPPMKSATASHPGSATHQPPPPPAEERYTLPDFETSEIAPTPAATAQNPLPLDSKSLEMLKEIRHEFNLSGDGEALRMLIKIGYTKAKTLFPGH